MKSLALLAVVMLLWDACPVQTDTADAGTTTGADVDFTGTFSGTVTETATCSDGSSVSQDASLTWALADTGTSVGATFNGQCSPIGFNGTDSLTVTQKDCGETPDGTQDITVTSGSITATDGGIALTFVLGSALTAGGTCSTTVSGALAKQ